MNHHRVPNLTAISISLVIFGAAIFLRAPSCYESLWVDELHSAWCVWGTFDQIVERAEVGHQTPIYFWGLWLWKQVVGQSELGLRFSSVLATSAACAILTYFMIRRFQCIAGGFTSGMILAIEQNSIFFGTELRPYALIILLSTIGLACSLVLLGKSRATGVVNPWFFMLGSIFLGLAIQPTSIGALICFPLFACSDQILRGEFKLKIPLLRPWSLALSVLTIIGAIALLQRTLLDSWKSRELWSAFGKSETLSQILLMWNWNLLLLLPLVISAIALLIFGFRSSKKEHRDLLFAAIGCTLICILITSFYWLLSYPPITPLWHRRYLIALLPVFACLSGLAVIFVSRTIGKQSRQTTSRSLYFKSSILGGILIGTLAWNQGITRTLHKYPIAYAKRGEHWREAIEYINQIASEKDKIWLSPGLIEERLYQRDESQSAETVDRRANAANLEKYLLYPLCGPYRIHNNAKLWLDHRGTFGSGGREILLARTHPRRLGTSLKNNGEIKGFGNLSVIISRVRK